MSIDTTAVRERISRTYVWSNTAGAPDPVRRAAAAHADAVMAADDSVLEYELEEAERRRAIKQHNEAVAQALRDGKLPPKAKVPSLEELEIKHGAIIAARESMVREAAAAADRVARECYPAWRASALERLQSAAAALTEAAVAAAQAARDWGGAAQVLARLDRSYVPRTAQLDDTSLLGLLDNWTQAANIEATQLGANVARHTETLRLLTQDPVVGEYDPAGGVQQYTAAFLAKQSPGVRAEMLRQAADSMPSVA